MMQKQQELDGIYDLRAIRVIVRDKTDCYAVLRQVSIMRPDPCYLYLLGVWDGLLVCSYALELGSSTSCSCSTHTLVHAC